MRTLRVPPALRRKACLLRAVAVCAGVLLTGCVRGDIAAGSAGLLDGARLVASGAIRQVRRAGETVREGIEDVQQRAEDIQEGAGKMQEGVHLIQRGMTGEE